MTHLPKAALFGLCLAASAALAEQQNITRDITPDAHHLQQQLDKQASEWLQEYAVPSVAVAYIKSGELAWTAVYGEQSPGVPASPQTLYNIASMTKPITAEVILRLAAAQQLGLDESMAGHWVDPDIKDNPWHRLLTPRIHLTHQTGFANWRRDTENRLTFQWQPGTQTGYSGEGYEYLARFAELNTGQNFTELARQYVFGPLQMHNSSYIERDWFAGRVAAPVGPGGEPGDPVIRQNRIASDDLYTTAADYAGFLISVMRNQGLNEPIAKQRLQIAQDIKDNLCHPERLQPEHCPERMGFGLGWSVFEYPQETVVMHGGGDWGERTLGFFVPERQLGVIIFTNGANGMRVIRDIAGMLYDNPKYQAFLNFQAR